MTDREHIDRQLKQHGVRLVPKTSSSLMRFIGFLLLAIGNRRFVDHYWTTLARTIYYPAGIADPLDHRGVLEHELVHVRQWERWNVILWLTYLLLPLPLGLAWFRWRWEREAYLVQLRRAANRKNEIVRIVESLWTGYGWPWPRRWMQRWFEKQVAS